MKKVLITSGKRKRAIARAVLREGKGIIKINNQLLDTFDNEVVRMRIMEPFILSGNRAKGIDFSVKVRGGGIQGQAEACRLAIAKGLVSWTNDENLKKDFLEYDRHLLVGDVRFKETRKPNDSKARKKRQSSKR